MGPVIGGIACNNAVEIARITLSLRQRLLAALRAGLDPAVFQSGEYDAPHRHVSKRGSTHLRRTLWLMALGAILHPGPLRDYYKRRRAGGLHHTSAVTATALKLCRIVWRVMTDQRDFTPEPPARPTAPRLTFSPIPHRT